ncbi:NADH-quinone oxidoreductase subunit C [Ideonella livida]|uniref:NADH-quinone oxidoreductase subunit C n=1 Tax=Ideonella livida TaxID=2707176 RepID=A0A7C9TK09_9BURK|nr:NADH-quinone oxidoreductase subunit C [Ideonella livida]NDY91424.1 NADH-quinone oxidoreductase subunit C [Ideonella livida]
MSQKLDALQAALESVLGARIREFKRDRGEITLTVSSADYLEVARTLRDDPALRFEQLIDLCGLDMLTWKDQAWDGPRFMTVVHLLSVSKNWRVRLKVFAPDDDLPVIASVNPIWSAANWFERESFDMYGIIYEGHEDLRRILTDYGFIGHPMRKDFPISGHVEMRYDPQARRVVYQPVTIEPREITPRVIREDNYGGLH